MYIGAEGESRAAMVKASLGRLRVRDLMNEEAPPSLPAEVTIHDAAERMLRERRLTYAVTEGGQPTGLITLQAVQAVAAERRTQVLVREIATRTPPLSPTDDAGAALRIMGETRASQLAVAEGGVLVLEEAFALIDLQAAEQSLGVRSSRALIRPVTVTSSRPFAFLETILGMVRTAPRRSPMRSVMKVQLPLIAWVALLAGCAPSSHVVRFRNASGAVWTYHPKSTPKSIEVSEQQFRETIRSTAPKLPQWTHPLEEAERLFGLPPRSGNYLYEVRTRRLLPEEEGSPLDEVSIQKWVADYNAWCAGTKLGPGDCLGILVGGRLTSHGRYVLALNMARGEVLEAAMEAARETGRPKAVIAMLVCASGMYLILWALPEPATKVVATFITVGLIGYLGFDTVIQLGVAFEQMVRESDQAKDIGELRAAGERFGRVFGQNAARALISLAAAAIGHTSGHLVSKLPALPSGGSAMAAALEEGGLSLAAVGEMEAVAVSAGGAVTVSLGAGSLAMAMVGGPPSSWTPPKEGPGEWVQVNESMPEFSRLYQSQVTGATPGWAYRHNGVDFDGYENGVLIEVKGRYAQFLKDASLKFPSFTGFRKIIDQARDQVTAARGARVRWVVAEREAAEFIRGLFATFGDTGLARIEVVHVPARIP